MTVTDNNSILIRNVPVGDVWGCSGQSNMELNMARASPLYPTEVANSENAFIRYFEISKRYDLNTPQTDVPAGRWVSIDPESILKCSAVAYFFALDLFEKYKVPIGLINASLPLPEKTVCSYGRKPKLPVIRCLCGAIRFRILNISGMPGPIIPKALTCTTRKACRLHHSGQTGRV